MINFFVQTDSKLPSITSMENKRLDNITMSDDNINLIKNISKRFNINTSFISDDKNLGQTISSINGSSFTVIHDYDIDKYLSMRLSNIKLFIHDEKNVFNNIVKISEIINGVLDLQIDIDNYDIDALGKEFDKILTLLEEFKDLTILQLNGFNIKAKFGTIGNNSVFISPDLKVYYHPNFYYLDKKPVCDFIDFDFLNENIFNEIKPHLVCLCCNTFYCDRDIYDNKINTSEYKVPSSFQCKKTTFLSHYSKKLYNLLNDEKMEIDENLDLIKEFKPDDAYDKMMSNDVECNIKKGISFNGS